jgi:hypothetical protein
VECRSKDRRKARSSRSPSGPSASSSTVNAGSETERCSISRSTASCAAATSSRPGSATSSVAAPSAPGPLSSSARRGDPFSLSFLILPARASLRGWSAAADRRLRFPEPDRPHANVEELGRDPRHTIESTIWWGVQDVIAMDSREPMRLVRGKMVCHQPIACGQRVPRAKARTDPQALGRGNSPRSTWSENPPVCFAPPRWLAALAASLPSVGPTPEEGVGSRLATAPLSFNSNWAR